MSEPPTINDLLAEFGNPPYTRADYDRDMALVIAGFAAAGITAEEIEPMIRAHAYRHDGGAIDTLTEQWMELKAAEHYL